METVLPLLTLLCTMEAFTVNDDDDRFGGNLFAKADLSIVTDGNDIASNLDAVKDSLVKNLRSGSLPSFSQLTDLRYLFDFPEVEETARTENVPVTIAPFTVVLKPVVERMPLTTMEFPKINYTFPINFKDKYESPYTHIDFEFPVTKSYTGGKKPTLDEIFENPRLIEGFEFNYGHPTHRDIVLRLVDVGRKSLQIIRSIPPLRAPKDDEASVPIDISEMKITVEGYPYDDANLIIPASQFLMPFA